MQPLPRSNFSIFHHLKKKPVPIRRNSYSSFPWPLATTNLFSVSMDLPLLDISYQWNDTIMWSSVIGFFHIMFSKFIYLIAFFTTSFLFMAENISLFGSTIFCLFISWRYIGCYHFWVTMNNTAINTHVQVCVWKYVLNSLGYLPMSGISESCGNFKLGTLRNCQMVFQSGCTIYIPNSTSKVSIFPTSCQYLLLSSL